MSYYRDDFYDQRERIYVQDGIKAQGKGKSLGGSQWWAKRWIEILKSFDMGARLTRGASYAKSGQVLRISFLSGKVIAAVQGSVRTPYSVEIDIKPLPNSAWNTIIPILANQAQYAALLLSGVMPQDIEKVFADAGCPLFPKGYVEITSSCSCPDWANPCKHIAAVYYIMGEEFDRDPFLLFTLRGMTREALLKRMNLLPSEDEDDALNMEYSPEPLPDSHRVFWKGEATGRELSEAEIVKPVISAAMLRRLGVFPLWRGSHPFLETLAQVYEPASGIGVRVALGQPLGGESQPKDDDACEE